MLCSLSGEEEREIHIHCDCAFVCVWIYWYWCKSAVRKQYGKFHIYDTVHMGCIFTYFSYSVCIKQEQLFANEDFGLYETFDLICRNLFMQKRTFTYLVHNKTNEWKTLKQSHFCPTQVSIAFVLIELFAVSVIAGHVFIVSGLCGCVCLALCVRWQESPESNCTHHTQCWMTGIPSDLLSLLPFRNHIPLPPIYQCLCVFNLGWRVHGRTPLHKFLHQLHMTLFGC